MARLRREPVPVTQLPPPPSKARRCSNHDRDGSEQPSKTRTQQRRLHVVESNGSSAEESDTPRNRGAMHNMQKSTQKRLVPLQSLTSSNSLSFNHDKEERTMRSQRKPRMRPKVGPPVSPRITMPRPMSKTVPKEAEETEETDIEESIWCGSIDGTQSSADESSELPSLRKLLHIPQRLVKNETKDVLQPGANAAQDLTKQFQTLRMFNDEDDDQYIFTKQQRPAAPRKPQKTQYSSEKEDNAPELQPPRPRADAPRQHNLDRPSTPPPPPSPGKLKSPSKRNVGNIPALPRMRPSIDAFWTADAVNDWNDQYSPQKPLKSPRKLKLQPGPEDDSPTTSPAKRNSPAKRTKAELELRQNFEARKHLLAESFLTELDSKVTGDKIADLAASTGGVRLIWSKTLNTTAGRANWRRESTKSKSRDGTATAVVHKHYASIELASKVIDDEHRLLNVLAHEFCHLANFMVSGIKDQPHGASFKQWGRKCTAAFADRGVEVTTKHTYEIEYKYIWQCEDEDCGVEFKRHSKSIDTARQRCGACRGNLVQIKPVPRKNGAVAAVKAIDEKGTTQTPGALNGYAAYVKQHFATLKKSMPGAAHKEVMEALGKRYRAEKAAKKSSVDYGSLAEEVARDLEKVNLGDVRERVVIELD